MWNAARSMLHALACKARGMSLVEPADDMGGGFTDRTFARMWVLLVVGPRSGMRGVGEST